MAKPSGQIYLLKNVPLLADYEHTIDFTNREEQFEYFYSFNKFTMLEHTYIRKEREYISVAKSMEELEDVNYLMFRSAEDERLYYAFVEDKMYLSSSSSYIYFSTDVIQTYMFDYKFNASYIKQAHVDRWNAEHKPIYSKTEEGLDYGTEYSIESAFKIEQSTVLKWLLVSMTDYSEIVQGGWVTEGGTIHPASPPFATFLIPLLLTKKGAMVPQDDGRQIFVNYTNTSGEAESKQIATYQTLIQLLHNSALGNYIRSVSLMTYNPFVDSEVIDTSRIDINFKSSVACGFTSFQSVSLPFLIVIYTNENIIKGAQTLALTDWNTGLENSLPTAEQWEELKNNPYTTKRDKRFESKLLCSPYRYNLLTDWRNNPVVFKNEYMTDDKIEVKFSYALSYNAPFRFWIKNYKKDPVGRNNSLSQPIALEFPIISDAYYTYMLENKNTIQANLTNTIISAGAGVVSGAMSGGVYGAVGGAIGGALNIQSQIRNENAKQMDLKAKPDNVINSTDSSFNILDDNSDVNFYRMRICCENEEIIAEIFNISGYKVNRVEVPNLRSRTRFNFIQTVGANITGSFNQADLQKIKQIFDSGITIWHYHKTNFNYLDYSFENVEVNLL